MRVPSEAATPRRPSFSTFDPNRKPGRSPTPLHHAEAAAPAPPHAPNPASGRAAGEMFHARRAFLGFAKIAVCRLAACSPGRAGIVQRRGWNEPEEFNEQLALCQVCPDPHREFSVMFGSAPAAWPGSLAALFVCSVPGHPDDRGGHSHRRYGELPELRGVSRAWPRRRRAAHPPRCK